MKVRRWILYVFVFVAVPVLSTAQHIVREFDAPGPLSRGLAWDGQYLWCADAMRDSIYKIDPTTGQVVHSIFFDFNTSYGGGITWAGDEALWVTRAQYFYKLRVSDGQGLANFHCPGG